VDASVEVGNAERLSGGWQTEVHRAGGIVYRSPGPQSPTVIALLRHLEAVGFEAAPRVIGDGFAPDGREILAYIEGRSPQPEPWSDDAVADIGRLLRRLHEATATFGTEGRAWRPWFARSLPGDEIVIGHGDLGPWNILARQGRPVAFIDWDNAGPVDATWELAQVAWLNVQLHDDDIAERVGLPGAAHRARQLRVLVDEYGLARDRRRALVDQMAELAVHEARQEAVDGGVTPDSSTAVAGNGYPILWAVAWRCRSASWILRHRTLLSDALLAD
jgi:signal transduction histidine kinase